ncbi:MAG: hypothetical protein ACI9NY_001491 [Kiritimatiellia bacterium]
MVKYVFIMSCGFIFGALVVEYKDYFAHQIPVPVAVLADGGAYDGELRKGLLEGKGRISWPSKNYYEGEFLAGLFHGKGILHTPAFLYQGEFQLGNANGEDTIDYANGDNYQGQVIFGLPSGYGVLEAGDGDVYKGEFKNSLYHGNGELVILGGDSYIGGFEAGLFHGEGVYSQVQQLLEANPSEVSPYSTYSGVFVAGQFTGEGVWIDNSQRYEGRFLDWKFHGEGLYSSPSGTYTGSFDHGRYEGKGVYLSAEGTHYKGGFSAGRYHGEGVFTSPIGDVYSGGFQYGLRHGSGKLTYAEELDGIREVRGEWEGGKLLNANHPRLAIAEQQLVEYALYHQADMLADELASLSEQNPEKIDLYFVGIAGDGSQGVFRREVGFIQDLFDQHYGTKTKSVSLINSTFSYDVKPLATVTSIRKTLQAVAEKMDKDNDILFLYLTSHGSRDVKLQLSQPGLALESLDGDTLGEMLASLPVRYKVVVISACYAGGFISKIKDDSMLVMAAAEADKTSFGCSDRARMTYFGEAFFKDSLLQSTSFVDTFYRARDIIRGREAKAGFVYSNPQIFKPKAIVEKLSQWRQQMASAAEEKIDFSRSAVE